MDPQQQGVGAGYCTTQGSTWFGEVLRSGYCGAATLFGVSVGGLTDIADTAGETVQGVASTAGETAQSVASPTNAFAGAAGFAVGGIGTTVALAGLGAFAIDQLVFGGVGTASLARRISSRGR